VYDEISSIYNQYREITEMSYQPMASLALRNPSPMTLRKSYKCPKRAARAIQKHLTKGTLKSVSKIEDRTVLSFYITSRRCDWHNWAYNYKTASEVRKQPAITISTCTALVNIIDTPLIVAAIETNTITEW
jgi:hypothetical protein